MTDPCGHPTATDDPCQLPGSFADGLCHHHTEIDGPEDAGRPTKLNRERQEQIAHIIEQGGAINEACRKAGINKATFYNWLDRGESESEGVFAEFFDRVTRAKGQGEGMYRQAILRIALENDDAATLMAMLKQRYPESWGEVDRGEQAGNEVQVFTEAPDKDELERLLRPDGDD